MITTTHIFNGQDTVFVPVVSLEEMPQLTTDERKHLIAELEQTEADMKAGAFETYSPEWLRQRFSNVFARSHGFACPGISGSVLGATVPAPVHRRCGSRTIDAAVQQPRALV